MTVALSLEFVYMRPGSGRLCLPPWVNQVYTGLIEIFDSRQATSINKLSRTTQPACITAPSAAHASSACVWEMHQECFDWPQNLVLL